MQNHTTTLLNKTSKPSLQYGMNGALPGTSGAGPKSELFALSVDRLTYCWSDPTESNVAASCQLVWDGIKHGMFPAGSNVKKSVGYKASALLQFSIKAKAFFQAGPYLPGHRSYRLDFNPSCFSQSDLMQLYTIVDGLVDEAPEKIVQQATVTRVDIALDLAGYTTDDVILTCSGKRKHACYSDAQGVPESVYLGTPRSARVVGYTKTIQGLPSFRLEIRLKPRCTGAELIALKNPFHKVGLLPAAAFEDLFPKIPHQIICDSLRVRGIAGIKKLCSNPQKTLIDQVIETNSSLLPCIQSIWNAWPSALAATGLFQSKADAGALTANEMTEEDT